MSPHTRSISQGLDGSLEEPQVHLCPPHLLRAVSYLPHKGAQLLLSGLGSFLLPLPNHPAWACPHRRCAPNPQLQTPGRSSFDLQRPRTPAPPPSHLTLGVPGWDPPMSQLYCRVSDYLSENNSPHGPFWKHVLREVTICRDELFCSKVPATLP